MNAELLVAGGIKLPLSILDSAPLGDIMGVYKLDAVDRQLPLARKALLMLLSSDLEQLEKRLEGLQRRTGLRAQDEKSR